MNHLNINTDTTNLNSPERAYVNALKSVQIMKKINHINPAIYLLGAFTSNGTWLDRDSFFWKIDHIRGIEL